MEPWTFPSEDPPRRRGPHVPAPIRLAAFLVVMFAIVASVVLVVGHEVAHVVGPALHAVGATPSHA